MANQPQRTVEFIMENVIKALADFPLPSAGLTSNENYCRVLDWLYNGDVAMMIVGLSYGLKKAEREALPEFIPREDAG